MYLAYYRPGQFPFPQGRSAGPYSRFLGAHSAGFARAHRQTLGAHAAAYARLRRRLGQDDNVDLSNLPLPSTVPPSLTPMPLPAGAIGVDSVTGQPIYPSGGNLPLPSSVGASLTQMLPAGAIGRDSVTGAPIYPTGGAMPTQSLLSKIPSTYLLGGFVGIVGLMAMAGRGGRGR